LAFVNKMLEKWNRYLEMMP